MRIADVITHVLEARLSQPSGWSFMRTANRASCLVEVICEDGTTGWGECFGAAHLNAAIVAAFRAHVVGMDALASEQIWMHLYNQFRDQGQRGLTITALSGLDVGLWDIKGKHFEAPVFALMGGPLRRQVSAYATGTDRRGSADPLTYIVDEVRGYAGEGFSAVKLKIDFGVADDAALVRACREAVGPNDCLMLDANHGSDASEAIALGRTVADCDIGWFEAPVVPEDLAGYQEVRRGQPIALAGGETWFTRWHFKDALSARAVDVIQPDICAAGGHSEAKKIADMAVAFGSLRAARVGKRRLSGGGAAVAGGAAPQSASPQSHRTAAGIRPLRTSLPPVDPDPADRTRVGPRNHSRTTGARNRDRPRHARPLCEQDTMIESRRAMPPAPGRPAHSLRGAGQAVWHRPGERGQRARAMMTARGWALAPTGRVAPVESAGQRATCAGSGRRGTSRHAKTWPRPEAPPFCALRGQRSGEPWGAPLLIRLAWPGAEPRWHRAGAPDRCSSFCRPPHQPVPAGKTVLCSRPRYIVQSGTEKNSRRHKRRT
jgi:D-galactarolactone cycloisomerase